MDMQKISMDIPVEMYNWLKENKINRTELFRNTIDELRYVKEQKISPLMLMVSIMGIVFSVALIGIGITPTPIHVYSRGLLCILGGVLAVSTMILYVKNRK